MSYPTDFRYTKEHEWIKVEGEMGTMGITDFAQHELGDIVLADLPAVGKQIEAHQAIGTIESVKAVSEIYSPVSGEVVGINDVLSSAPEKINQDPHGSAWLVKIRLSAPAEVGGLLTAEQYEDYIKSAGH